MVARSRRLPPINAVVAFEAAARHLSFTRAARELYVTRVAASRQAKALEEHFGCPLFLRGPRSLALTPEGEFLATAAREGLGRIAEAADSLKRRVPQGGVTLASTIGIATYWLMPRVSAFRTLHPDVEIRLVIASDPEELTFDSIDVAVRYGDRPDAGVERRLIARHAVRPLCSPRYLEAHVRPARPDDLLQAHLLHFEEPKDPRLDWYNWFQLHGIDDTERHARTSFSSYVNFVQAMLDGHGIGLGGAPSLSGFLESGQLIPLLDLPPMALEGYYVCWQDGRPRSALARTFLDWLLDRIDQGQAAVEAVGHGEAPF